MKKSTIERFGKKYFLLGIRKEDNKKVWLEDFSWDCNWYWGGGYLEVFNHNKTDIDEHFHFDNTFLEGNSSDTKKGYMWDAMSYWKKTVFNENEWWRLQDLFKQFYILRDAAEVYQYGGNFTSKWRNEKEINRKMADTINEHIGKVIIPEIRKMFEK